jgi:hypothetical protein
MMEVETTDEGGAIEIGNDLRLSSGKTGDWGVLSAIFPTCQTGFVSAHQGWH